MAQVTTTLTLTAFPSSYRIVFKLFEDKILILASVDRKVVYRQSER
jgi:hypothetical protein